MANGNAGLGSYPGQWNDTSVNPYNGQIACLSANHSPMGVTGICNTFAPGWSKMLGSAMTINPGVTYAWTIAAASNNLACTASASNRKAVYYGVPPTPTATPTPEYTPTPEPTVGQTLLGYCSFPNEQVVDPNAPAFFELPQIFFGYGVCRHYFLVLILI